MRRPVRRAAGPFLLILALGLAACAVTDPTRYYVLASGPGSAARHLESGTGVAVGVGPVQVAGYLDRTQIVTRSEADQVELANFHRWAEPLGEGVTRALTDDLAARIPTERIASFPWSGAMERAIDYQVVVTVMRFDGRLGGDVMLDTRWRLVGRGGKELVLKRATITEATGGPGFERLVAAMSRAVAGLGSQIAAEIRAQPR